MNITSKNEKMKKNNWKDEQMPAGQIPVTELSDAERQPCETWTRVMGYFRPLSEFNKGKKAEFLERKCFDEHRINHRN